MNRVMKKPRNSKGSSLSAGLFRRLGVALAVPLASLLALSGCGYHFQRSESPLLEKEGIRRIYISPLVNNSYKPGAENLVYNVLLKALTVNRYIRLVEDPSLADATLSGSVSRAEYGPSASAAANSVSPLISNGSLYQKVYIATEYSAGLDCTFTLTRRNPGRDQRALVWSGNFSRSKPFIASNQLGAFGTTSALINESEFERALGDLAQSMMGDLRESMLSRF